MSHSHHPHSQFSRLKDKVSWRKRAKSLEAHDLSMLVVGKSKEEPASLNSMVGEQISVHQRRRVYSIGSPDPAHLPKSYHHHAAILVKQDNLPVDCPTPILVNRSSSRRDSIDSLENERFSPPSLDSSFVTAFLVDNPELGYSQLLQAHSCYDAVPNNNKLVVFDTKLPVKKAFYALIYNCVRSALVCDDKTCTLTGILSITDFIRILLRFYANPESVAGDETADASKADLEDNSHEVEKQLDEHEIGSWRSILKKRGCVKPLITLMANHSLYRAAQVLSTEGIHRIPILDPNTRNPLYILTYKRLLKFMWLFGARLPRPDFMDETPLSLGVGVWGQDVITVFPDTPLIDCLRHVINQGVSGLPVLTRPDVEKGDWGGKVVDMYTRFDAIGIAAQGNFDNLGMTVEDALMNRKDSQDFEGVVQCLDTDNLWTVIDKVVSAEVHRIVIVDTSDRLTGLVTMSNIIRFLVIRPTSTDSSPTEQERGGDFCTTIKE